MSDGGVKMGLTRQMSNAIASQTVKVTDFDLFYIFFQAKIFFILL